VEEEEWEEHEEEVWEPSRVPIIFQSLRMYFFSFQDFAAI
jgi:hypothetical protein